MPKPGECDWKVAYPSELTARNAATAIGWRTEDYNLEAYECPHCGQWHIGHHSRWQPRRAGWQRVTGRRRPN